jgi:hypothetical protein
MKGFILEVSEDGYSAYLRLPGNPGKGFPVSRTLNLADVLGNYNGPDISIDFDQEDRMIGVEFLAEYPEEDDL